MFDSGVTSSVKRYLRALSEHGIPASFGVVFGSYATGKATELSDIDLVVVSPRFDRRFSQESVNWLWRVAARTDSRIEPIPCGERQWVEDQGRPIIEIARREGVRIDLDQAA
jgi:hypothetical protein